MNIKMEMGYFLDPFGTVEKLVKKWNPRGCKTEKDFESSLVSTLERELSGKNSKAIRVRSPKSRYCS